ncbi:hypothetical protein LEP1GSC058_1928 [Leptospira fainei serovar Hurstbridge str. BUT 6]|uniref:Uncharacterized protein n=1 Tax=Leptospira fainei serovar Hurstbridge str. BUT 6 TaxID=1193011 RepID=S3V4S7_9LEPT|nr:hypothetical protein LEP1GSC058_1928 [Leptospira fainei serovar Hurstbridge str. BUT 6]
MREFEIGNDSSHHFTSYPVFVKTKCAIVIYDFRFSRLFFDRKIESVFKKPGIPNIHFD